jgi:VanZ family protein
MRVTRANSLLMAGLLYALGIGVISLSPISAWQFIPEVPWAYLAQPWPRYWTGFDVMVNVLAYMPLGLLIARAAGSRLRHSDWRAAQALLMAMAFGLALSILMEGLQTYLPSRRPSTMDVAANGLGTFIGAFIASLYTQRVSRFHLTETRPTEIGGLMLLGLWILAQAAPQPVWLALGDIGIHADWRPQVSLLANPSAAGAMSAAELFAAQRILTEALCVASAITSCALIAHLTLLDTSRWFANYKMRYWVSTLVAIIAITAAARAGWIVTLQSTAELGAWLNPGAQAGIILALLGAYGLAGARPVQQRVAAIAGIVVMLVLSNSLPENYYAAQAFGAWFKGKWFNLENLANFSAMAWPFAALAWLFIALPRRSMIAIERNEQTHRSR